MRRFLLIALGAIMALAFRPDTAHAVEIAVVTVDLNVRGGQGVNYPRIAVLRPGTRVEVEYCTQRRWCRIYVDGLSGYVSQRYLSFDAYAYAPPVVDYYHPPVVYFHHFTAPHVKKRRHFTPRRAERPRRVERRRAHRSRRTEPRRTKRQRTERSRRTERRRSGERRQRARSRRDARGSRSVRRGGRDARRGSRQIRRGGGERRRGGNRRQRSDLFAPGLPSVAPARYVAHVDGRLVMTL